MRKLRHGLIILAALFVTTTGVVKAQSVWSGGSGTNGNWSRSFNWSAGAPANNTTAAFTFTAGGSWTSPNNDLTGITASSITFGSGASAFTLLGNSIKLTGIVQNNSTALQTISTMPLVLTNATAVNFNAATGGLTIDSVISESGSSKVTINSTAASTGIVMIIVAADETKPVPDQIKRWLDSVLQQQRDGRAVLVALHDDKHDDTCPPGPLCSHLERLAGRWQTEFMCNQDFDRRLDRDFAMQFIRQKRDASFRPHQPFGIDFYSAPVRGGINE